MKIGVNAGTPLISLRTKGESVPAFVPARFFVPERQDITGKGFGNTTPSAVAKLFVTAKRSAPIAGEG